MSTLAWLDYSEHDRRLALDVIDKFREHDTRDELGLGSIRDAFADLLFPGTGTVQTRPRYFLFIPWIYQRLEKRRTPSKDIAVRARRDELNLIEVLMEGADTEGVIGRVARRRLKRLPSSIYWQGLGVLGIRTFRGSQAAYHRYLDRFYRDGPVWTSTGDTEPAAIRRRTNWLPSLPPPPAGFPDEAELNLTSAEADFLRDRVVLSWPSSVFRFFIQANTDDAFEIEFPWEHPGVVRLPERQQEEIGHARSFSEIMHGASLLYNLMLAERSGNPDFSELVTHYRERLEEWREQIIARRAIYRSWRRQRMWALLSHARISLPTREFVENWCSLTIADPVPRASGTREQRVLITERERRLKRNQARLSGGRPLELWSGESGAAQLTYRWGVTRRFLADLCAATGG